MAYCTLAQLIDTYGQAMLVAATDRGDIATGVIDTAAIDRAIASGDALIDGFLAGAQYQLPLSPVPPLLNSLSLVISAYKAHAAVADEKLRQDYQDALKLLRDIGAGTVRLDVAGAEPTRSSPQDVRTNAPDRPFSADTMRGYI